LTTLSQLYCRKFKLYL